VDDQNDKTGNDIDEEDSGDEAFTKM